MLWAIDVVTAVLLILVPYASELNPVTVFFYVEFGIPGVVFVGCVYAAIVVVIGNVLPHPSDLAFVAVIVALYLFFVFNNLLVLLFDQSIWTLGAVGLSSGCRRAPPQSRS
ncbi:hypothetical protein [Natrarchaeobaculum aegyptiacum]|uniref:hypothetical protein n=1 Tax=Natrarchaeobaculum aegyptiacum TaxID=745377 RepID=UPI002B20AAC5|nr:hypothetical protein [Natrarchaeobaculum aegyptiacum]